MQVPQFKSHIHPSIIEEDKLILSSEFGQQLLTGKSLVHVVKHMRESETVDEIINKLEGVVDAAQVHYVLAVLETKKYASIPERRMSEAESAFWSSMGVDETKVIDKKKSTKIKLYSFGKTPIDYLADELKAQSFTVVEQKENFALLLTDDYLRSGLIEKARALWKQGIPFFVCKPNGVETWLGPIFNPPHTACFDCLTQRLIANRDIEVYLKETGIIDSPLVTKSSLLSTRNAGLQMALTEISKFIVMGKSDQLENGLITFNHATLQSAHHTVVKRPQCPTCGEAQYRETSRLPEKIAFQSSPKNFIDGGHRSVTARETYQRFKHLISPISGIVNKLERITSESDELQHVFISGQNMAIKTNSFKSLRKNLRSNSCGKGVTEIQAKVSAIGEAIERYSGVFRGEEPRIKASYRSLGTAAIHPNDCMLFSKEQYDQRDHWNGLESHFNVIPVRLDEAAEIDWSPLWSVSRQDYVYLPSAYCYYSHPENGKAGFFCAPDSNGCAAGNTREEAILQGFLELIERDSVCLWWYNRLRMPRLDLDSFQDAYANQLRTYHKSRHRDLWVLDLTADSGIPAFIAISARNDRMDFQDIVFAPAAHLDPRVALRRALTELNQMMPSVDSDLPKGEYWYDDPETVKWWRTSTTENQPYLLPDNSQPPRKLEDFKQLSTTDIKDDLAYCCEVVDRMGLEMHILDQTRPDIGLYVVKVVIPGLRHFWARYASGRLYDVPVKMGWLPTAKKESELNPISMFI
ncbi:MAG: TOMM precursor leader peptide-binding protein [Bacteroidota bacterium]